MWEIFEWRASEDVFLYWGGTLKIRARYLNMYEVLGYNFGKVYEITIEGNNVVEPYSISYKSVEGFLFDWLPLKPGD